MADLAVTAANVVKGSDAVILNGTLGATVTAGQTLYLDTTTNTYKLADANASATTAVLAGVALNGGASGQPVQLVVGGSYNPGGTAVVGTIYVQSGTAGGIAPSTDLVSGWFTSIWGIGTTASNIKIVNLNSGVAVP
jgi:hypothetical protein